MVVWRVHNQSGLFVDTKYGSDYPEIFDSEHFAAGYRVSDYTPHDALLETCQTVSNTNLELEPCKLDGNKKCRRMQKHTNDE